MPVQENKTNCLITILQNKRISLPYIFNKYCFPMMKERFNGRILYYHILHNLHDSKHNLFSNKQLCENKLKLVEEYIKQEKFKNAHILSHERTSAAWPALHSVKIAANCLGSIGFYDFHLWMEDDAIIYDTDCDQWATILGSADVGLYRNTDKKQMINTAYFLSTPEFDHRILRILEEFHNDLDIRQNKGLFDNFKGGASTIEHLFWRAARKPVLLNPDHAMRHHPYVKHRRTGEEVRRWLRRTIPNISNEDIELTKQDFDD